MTSYTDNRRYPYPDSEREAGNGGLHSELLARAIAADLDILDAGWTTQATRPYKTLGLTSNITGLGAGTRSVTNMTTILKVVQPAYFTTDATQIKVAIDGWYYANLNIQAAASGTVTVNARLQNWIRHLRPNDAGTLVKVPPTGERFGDTYWPSSTAACWNRVGGMFRMVAGDRLWIDTQHSNTGSTVNIVVAGTSITATRVCGL